LRTASRAFPHDLLAGWWAGIVVTMGLPALIYRWYFHGH